ncbi:hypothetical protein AOLI_G00150730 [Acnodon oligacanthus]
MNWEVLWAARLCQLGEWSCFLPDFEELSKKRFCSRHGLPTKIADHIVHTGLVLQEKWTHHMPVQHLRAIPGERGHAPQQEQALATHKDRALHKD